MSAQLIYKKKVESSGREFLPKDSYAFFDPTLFDPTLSFGGRKKVQKRRKK